MYQKILQEILTAHPLFGIEKETQNLGKRIGLKPPDWIYEGPVYEIFVRNFSKSGTIDAVRNKLSYIKDLGVKTIWLMPIHPIGVQARKGSFGSPYAIRDFYEINEVLGTKRDFKNLVESVHENDMRIILDLVINHTTPDHVWSEKNPEFLIGSEDQGRVRKHPDWTDIIDLDYENEELREEMRQMIRYWVNAFNIDGFRCDVAGLVPSDFWKEVYKDLRKVKKDIFLLAEWESARLHLMGFHATYDWSTYFILNDISEGKRPVNDCLTWVIEKEANFPRYSLPFRFTENHDFPRTRDRYGEHKFYPYVTLLFCLKGIPLLYAGQEIGARNTPALFEKDMVPWSEGNKKILQFYKKLIEIRNQYPVFRTGSTDFLENKNPSVLAFKRQDPKTLFYILLNFSDKEQMVGINEGTHKTVQDLLNDEMLTLDKIILDPNQARILNIN